MYKVRLCISRLQPNSLIYNQGQYIIDILIRNRRVQVKPKQSAQYVSRKPGLAHGLSPTLVFIHGTVGSGHHVLFRAVPCPTAPLSRLLTRCTTPISRRISSSMKTLKIEFFVFYCRIRSHTIRHIHR